MMIFLLVAGAVVLLLVGATAGLALSGRLVGSADATPDNDSVDAGFARDMIVHHDQGVLMAHYAEKNTTDPEIDVMAYDIGYTQTDQIGQMQGWLSLWDLPESGDGTHMGWMGGTADSHGMTMDAPAAGVGFGGWFGGGRRADPADARDGDRCRDLEAAGPHRRRVGHLLPATDGPAPPGRRADDAVRRRARDQPGGPQLRVEDGAVPGRRDLRDDADARRAGRCSRCPRRPAEVLPADVPEVALRRSHHRAFRVRGDHLVPPRPVDHLERRAARPSAPPA